MFPEWFPECSLNGPKQVGVYKIMDIYRWIPRVEYMNPEDMEPLFLSPKDREKVGTSLVAFREHSGNIRGTFYGIFGEHSGNI
jgi:hypothetical protein